MPSPGPVIFLHLPKTGGTALREVIIRQFPGGAAFRFDGSQAERNHWAALTQQERDRFALVEGHLYYGVQEQLSSPPPVHHHVAGSG